MSMSPSIFLIIYAVLFGIFSIIAILNFYHIVRFGVFKKAGFVISAIFLVLVLIIATTTFSALGNINWDEPIEIDLPFISNDNDRLE